MKMVQISQWQLIERHSQPTVVIKETVALNQLIPNLNKHKVELLTYLTSQNSYPAGDFFVYYHQFGKEGVTYEAGFPLAVPLNGTGSIEPSQKVAGLYLSCYDKGPYQKIPKLYKETEKWLADHGFVKYDQSEEIYLNDHEDEDQLLTQLLIAVRPLNLIIYLNQAQTLMEEARQISDTTNNHELISYFSQTVDKWNQFLFALNNQLLPTQKPTIKAAKQLEQLPQAYAVRIAQTYRYFAQHNVTLAFEEYDLLQAELMRLL